MKKETFADLTSRMGALLNECQQWHNRTGSGRDAMSLTIERFNSAISEARALQSKCDKVVTTDLYHIIGMGNLSASQLSSFIKQVKQLSTYRHDLKWFSNSDKLSVRKYDNTSNYSASIISDKLKVSHKG